MRREGGEKCAYEPNMPLLKTACLKASRTLPLINVLLNRVGIQKSWEAAAISKDVLQTAEIEALPPAIHLPGQPVLIKGVNEGDSLKIQISNATCLQITHAPVVRHTLKNCLVTSAGVEFLSGSLRKRSLRPKELLARPLSEIADAAYCDTILSHKYFGHFLADACTTALLTQPQERLLLAPDPQWQDAPSYLAAFALRPEPPSDYFVHRLSVYSDMGQGSLKRARYRDLQRRVEESYGPRGTPTDIIYLRRGATGAARQVAEEDRLCEALVKEGYRIVDVQGNTLQSLAKSLRFAKRVISMEGSHINHVYYLAPRGVQLCVLMPENRATFIHRFQSQAFGATFGYLVCTTQESCYKVDILQLQRTLSLFD